MEIKDINDTHVSTFGRHSPFEDNIKRTKTPEDKLRRRRKIGNRKKVLPFSKPAFFALQIFLEAEEY